VALLFRTVPFGTLELTATTTLMVTTPAGARFPKVQVSGCSGLPGIPAVQEPVPGDTESTLTWPGIVSLTTTPVAVDGPALLTVIVYVKFVPATTGFGSPVLLMERSAPATKLTCPVALLFAVFGSGVVLDTVAVSFMSLAPVLVKLTVTVADAPPARVPKLQATLAVVTTPGGKVQVPTEGETEVIWKGLLATMLSFKVTFWASDGPLLVTVIVQSALLPAWAGESGLQTFMT